MSAESASSRNRLGQTTFHSMTSAFREVLQRLPASNASRQQSKPPSIGSAKDIDLLRTLVYLDARYAKSGSAHPHSVPAPANSGVHNQASPSVALSGLQNSVLRELIYRRNFQYPNKLSSGHERLELLGCAVEPQRLAVDSSASVSSAGKDILSTATSDLTSWTPYRSGAVYKKPPSSSFQLVGILLLELVSSCDQWPPELEFDACNGTSTSPVGLKRPYQPLIKDFKKTASFHDGDSDIGLPLLPRRANTWPLERGNRGSRSRQIPQNDYMSSAWESLKWKRRHVLAVLVWVDGLALNPGGASSSLLQYEETWVNIAVMDAGCSSGVAACDLRKPSLSRGAMGVSTLSRHQRQFLTAEDTACAITSRPSGRTSGGGSGNMRAPGGSSPSSSNYGASNSLSGPEPKRRRVDEGHDDDPADGDEGGGQDGGRDLSRGTFPSGFHPCPAGNEDCGTPRKYGTLVKHLKEKHPLIIEHQILEATRNRKAPKFAKLCKKDSIGRPSNCEQCKTEDGLKQNLGDPGHDGPSVCMFCWAHVFQSRQGLLDHIKENREGNRCTGREGMPEDDKVQRLRELFQSLRIPRPSAMDPRVITPRPMSIPIQQRSSGQLAMAPRRPVDHAVGFAFNNNRVSWQGPQLSPNQSSQVLQPVYQTTESLRIRDLEQQKRKLEEQNKKLEEENNKLRNKNEELERASLARNSETISQAYQNPPFSSADTRRHQPLDQQYYPRISIEGEMFDDLTMPNPDYNMGLELTSSYLDSNPTSNDLQSNNDTSTSQSSLERSYDDGDRRDGYPLSPRDDNYSTFYHAF